MRKAGPEQTIGDGRSRPFLDEVEQDVEVDDVQGRLEGAARAKAEVNGALTRDGRGRQQGEEIRRVELPRTEHDLALAGLAAVANMPRHETAAFIERLGVREVGGDRGGYRNVATALKVRDEPADQRRRHAAAAMFGADRDSLYPGIGEDTAEQDKPGKLR